MSTSPATAINVVALVPARSSTTSGELSWMLLLVMPLTTRLQVSW
jgi:hypothetical protein